MQIGHKRQLSRFNFILTGPKGSEMNAVNKVKNIINTEIIKVSTIKPQSFAELIMDLLGDLSETYNYVKDLEDSYPDFYKWYHNKVLKELKQKNGRREILLSISTIKLESEEVSTKKVISGIAVLKNYESEKKICTFRLIPDFYRTGLSDLLMNESMKFLKTKTPMITISENRVELFENILARYEFKLSQKLPDYYKKGLTEFVYNGKLE